MYGSAMFVILIGLVLTPLGIVLLWSGLWPRRRGTTPHCRQCEYNLTGLAADRCPECGTPLGPLGPVFGERRRSMVRVAIGVLCLTPVAGAAVFIARNVDWYRHYPAAWVLNDLQSAVPGPSNKAWRELMRRDTGGSLSAKHRSRLIDLCLQQQAANAPRPPTDEMVNYLGRCSLAGRLSENQESTFFSQIGQLAFRVRPRVGPGDPVPYYIAKKCRGPSGGWWMTLEDTELLIDGKSTGQRVHLSGGASSGYGAGGGSGGSFQCPTSGHHSAEIRPHVLVYHGQFGQAGASTLVHRREVLLTATFEVLTEEPPDYIHLVQGSSTNHHLSWIGQGPSVSSCDVILRASPKAARNTVDLFEIWDGELIYEGVPVKLEGATSAPDE